MVLVTAGGKRSNVDTELITGIICDLPTSDINTLSLSFPPSYLRSVTDDVCAEINGIPGTAHRWKRNTVQRHLRCIPQIKLNDRIIKNLSCRETVKDTYPFWNLCVLLVFNFLITQRGFFGCLELLKTLLESVRTKARDWEIRRRTLRFDKIRTTLHWILILLFNKL